MGDGGRAVVAGGNILRGGAEELAEEGVGPGRLRRAPPRLARPADVPDRALSAEHPRSRPAGIHHGEHAAASHDVLRVPPDGADDLPLRARVPDREHAAGLPVRFLCDTGPVLRERASGSVLARLGAGGAVARGDHPHGNGHAPARARFLALPQEPGLAGR